jgi:ATPase family associated with various cellular activities (AAA)
MTSAPVQDWQSVNQLRLSAALAELKSVLRRHADLVRPSVNNGKAPLHPPKEVGPSDPSFASVPEKRRFLAGDEPSRDGPPAALETLCATFRLSPFERNVLLLCAGIELDSAFASLCAAAQGEPGRNFPTFSLALAALPDAHWSALSPDAPLRRWRLIEVGAGPALTVAPLRIDERVLHYLAGVPQLDDRLAGLVEPIAPVGSADLAPSHEELARRVAAVWTAFRGHGGVPVVQLCGGSPGDCRAVAAAAAAAVGLRALAIAADLVPAAAAELDALLRLWEREAALGGAVLLVECDGPDLAAAGDDARSRASGTARLVERVGGLVIVSVREPRPIALRPSVNFDVHRPTTGEQRAAWHETLGQAADTNPTGIAAVASQFSMSFPSIRSVAAEALTNSAASPDLDIAVAAWHSCRARCRTRLDGLAQRIEPAARWADIVLPEPQIQALRQIAIHVRHRTTVYEMWGFAAKCARGLGISALFAGTSGTGKTMAAEVLANELRLDLYRIDLSSVVSKYIGETEKNLRRVFDAAEESGAILLFDEADALFGKRSEVKDSHDRYANIEVSYLLQRMEAYRGLAILTTNRKESLDSAFLRRIRFVVQFPFPDATQRAEIWRRIFPAQTPTDGLDLSKLSRLNVAGGNIRNIAMNAAFHAAEAGEPVRMIHLREAAKSEYAKLERPLTEAEIRGWI